MKAIKKVKTTEEVIQELVEQVEHMEQVVLAAEKWEKSHNEDKLKNNNKENGLL
jgi:hypothetical protein